MLLLTPSFNRNILAFVVGAFVGMALFFPLLSTTFAESFLSPGATSHYGTDDTAPRYVFLPADAAKQVVSTDPNNLPEIWMNYRWRSGLPVRWFIDDVPPDPDFKNKIQNAIANWNVAVPLLQWNNYEEISRANADVFFTLSPCVFVGFSGKYSIQIEPGSLDLWGSADYWRRANYVTKATICVSSSPFWAPPEDHAEILLHEMGHAYGLHERYRTDLSCNPEEVSVMNGINCDGLTAPASLDTHRVDMFWGKGWGGAPAMGYDVAGAALSGNTSDLFTIRPLAGSGGNLRVIWGDYSWGQTSYTLWVEEWWNGTWNFLFCQYWVDDDVGAHSTMAGYPQVDMRIMEFDFDALWHGMPNHPYYHYNLWQSGGHSGGAYYRVWIYAHNYGYGFGPGRVSAPLWFAW